jgi:hypothetical protein
MRLSNFEPVDQDMELFYYVCVVKSVTTAPDSSPLGNGAKRRIFVGEIALYVPEIRAFSTG